MSNPKYTAEPPLLCKTFPRLTSSPGDLRYRKYSMRTEWRVSLGFSFIVVLLNDSDVLVEAENGAGKEERLGDVVEKTGDHVVDVDHLVGSTSAMLLVMTGLMCPERVREILRLPLYPAGKAAPPGGYRRSTRRVETGMKKAKGILAGDAFSL